MKKGNDEEALASCHVITSGLYAHVGIRETMLRLKLSHDQIKISQLVAELCREPNIRN